MNTIKTFWGSSFELPTNTKFNWKLTPLFVSQTEEDAKKNIELYSKPEWNLDKVYLYEVEISQNDIVDGFIQVLFGNTYAGFDMKCELISLTTSQDEVQ